MEVHSVVLPSSLIFERQHTPVALGVRKPAPVACYVSPHMGDVLTARQDVLLSYFPVVADRFTILSHSLPELAHPTYCTFACMT